MISKGAHPSEQPEQAEATDGHCQTAMSSLMGWAELAIIDF
jgi:hypothetical protein